MAGRNPVTNDCFTLIRLSKFGLLQARFACQALGRYGQPPAPARRTCAGRVGGWKVRPNEGAAGFALVARGARPGAGR